MNELVAGIDLAPLDHDERQMNLSRLPPAYEFASVKCERCPDPRTLRLKPDLGDFFMNLFVWFDLVMSCVMHRFL